MKKIHVSQKAIKGLKTLHFQLPVKLVPHSSKEFIMTLLNEGKEEGIYQLYLDEEVLQNLVKCLQMEFLNESPQEGKVCFAQSDEVRDDFKTFFTAVDLLAYLNSLEEIAFIEKSTYLLWYPSDSQQFWKSIKKTY